MDDAVWFVSCVRKFRAARDGGQLSAESDMYAVHRVARMWSVDDEASDRIGRIQPMGRCTYVIAAVGSCQPLISDEWASDDAIASVTNLQWPGFETMQ